MKIPPPETEAEMDERHANDWEDAHNGSGLTEEFPSDMKVRHRMEREQLERRMGLGRLQL